MNRAVRQSERYRVMQESGCSAEEIERSFRTPVDMTVFTYHGDIDTVMTPLDSIRYYKSFLRAGFLSMDAHNGHVKAYVGGIDFEHFQYDMVMGGRRQVGSTIKPFLYSLAMENGASPCDRAPNVQQTYMVGGKPWTPRNANRRRYGQMVTLKWGLAQSNNWISAYLMSRLNPGSLSTSCISLASTTRHLSFHVALPWSLRGVGGRDGERLHHVCQQWHPHRPDVCYEDRGQ